LQEDCRRKPLEKEPGEERERNTFYSTHGEITRSEEKKSGRRGKKRRRFPDRKSLRKSSSLPFGEGETMMGKWKEAYLPTR